MVDLSVWQGTLSCTLVNLENECSPVGLSPPKLLVKHPITKQLLRAFAVGVVSDSASACTLASTTLQRAAITHVCVPILPDFFPEYYPCC